jgi:hypothetical protein
LAVIKAFVDEFEAEVSLFLEEGDSNFKLATLVSQYPKVKECFAVKDIDLPTIESHISCQHILAN